MDSHNPDLKNDGFAGVLALLLVVVVIAVAISAFIFFKSQKVSAPLPLPQNAPVKTTESLPEWKTYTNSEAGFSLKYPSTVLFEADLKGATKPVLSISAQKLSDIPEDLPSLMGRNDALKQKAELAKGGGETTVKVGTLYGTLGMTLSQFEMCSVILNRSLTFYPGEYRVIISFSGPKKEIMDSMPEFFTEDRANCGDKKIWNRSNPKDFEKTLAKKEGAGMGQVWYDTFDEIVKTVTLTTPSSNAPTPSPTVSKDLSTFKNEQYGFEISYPKTYQVLNNKDALSGYPNGVVLFYNGGQAYDVVIEVWNTKAEYESNYATRLSDVSVKESKGKFITLLNNTHAVENEKIIASFKLLP